MNQPAFEQPKTVWQQLTIGFPKRRHVYVHRLPVAVPLLGLATAALVITTCLNYTTGGVIAATLAGLLTIYFARLHRLTQRCWSVEQAAAETDRTIDEVQRIISEKHVAPEFVVDGRPVYAPAQLSEALLLLRATDGEDQNNLLRAAGTNSSSDAEHLVRPVTGDSPSSTAAAPFEAPAETISVEHRQ
jgi:hypothetical protein